MFYITQEDGDGGDEEQLTHMGTSLSHLDEDDLHGPRDDDQEDNEEGPSGEVLYIVVTR